METKFSRKSILILITIIVVIVIILLLPIKFSYSINAPGKIVHAREWIISKGTDGRLITELVDNKKGVNQKYFVTQFDRGDASSFNIHPDISAGSEVKMNDTVGIIYSNEIERVFIELKRELETARYSLKSFQSGEKKPLIEEAEQRLKYAERQVVEQEKIFRRQKVLYERKLISEEEYEIEKGKTDLFKINVEIAEAQLLNVKSGAKPEEIEYIKSQIIGLQNEIDILGKRFSEFTVISPITGIARRTFSPDTILIIGDTTEFVVYMPFEWKERKYIKTGQLAKIDIRNLNNIPEATVLNSDNTIHSVSGNQVLMVAASIPNPEGRLMPGMITNCSIICDEVTLKEYLSRIFSSIIN